MLMYWLVYVEVDLDIWTLWRNWGNALSGCYVEAQHPHAMMFYPTKGSVVTDLTSEHLDCILVSDVVFYLYTQHRRELSFQHINVY